MMHEQDDDITMFDRASLLGSESSSRKPSRKQKLFNTFALLGAFFGVGLALAIPGPTLHYLQCQVDTDLRSISYIFPARSLGYLFGSIVGGFLFDKLVNRDKLLVSVALVTAAISVGAAPFTSSLVLLCILLSITSIAMGFLDTGGNVICLRIWGKDSGPYMQALHFAFGIGAFMAPLVAAPFLSTAAHVSCNSTTANISIITIKPLLEVADRDIHKRQQPLGSLGSAGNMSTFDAPEWQSTTMDSYLDSTTITMKSPTTTGSAESVRQKPPISGVTLKNDSLNSANGMGLDHEIDKVAEKQETTVPNLDKAGTNVNTTLLSHSVPPLNKSEETTTLPISDELSSYPSHTTTHNVEEITPTDKITPTVTGMLKNQSSTPVSTPITIQTSITPMAASSSQVTTTSSAESTTTVKTSTTTTTTTTSTTTTSTTPSTTTSATTSTTTSTTTLTPTLAPLTTPTTTTPPITTPTTATSPIGVSADSTPSTPAVPGSEEQVIEENEDINPVPDTGTTIDSNNSTKPADAKSPFDMSIKEVINKISKVQFSYLIVASVMMFFGLIFCCLDAPKCTNNSTMSSSGQKSENDLQDYDEVTLAPSRSYTVKVMSSVFIFFFLYVGTEVAYGQFIATFSIKHNNFSPQQASFLTSIYWGMFALTRGLAVPMSKCLSPAVMIIVSILTTCGSIVGLAIAMSTSQNSTALWALSGTLGAGMAAIFPTGILWLEGYIKVTSKMAAIFVCASALGEMVVPAASGYLIDKEGPISLIYTTLICIVGCGLTFIIMHCFASSKGSQYSRVSGDGSSMPMERFEFSDSDETDSEPILNRNGRSRKQVSYP